MAEIMKELLENEAGSNDKAPLYVQGYTGYIPGFNSGYGQTFRNAVDTGAIKWHEDQMQLKSQDAIRAAHAEQTDPRYVLSRARTDNVDFEIDHGHDKDIRTYEYHVSPERSPLPFDKTIVGYTGHIPGAREEVDHSEGYAQAARTGFEGVQRERDDRHASVI